MQIGFHSPRKQFQPQAADTSSSIPESRAPGSPVQIAALKVSRNIVNELQIIHSPDDDVSNTKVDNKHAIEEGNNTRQNNSIENAVINPDAAREDSIDVASDTAAPSAPDSETMPVNLEFTNDNNKVSQTTEKHVKRKPEVSISFQYTVLLFMLTEKYFF